MAGWQLLTIDSFACGTAISPVICDGAIVHLSEVRQ